MTPRRIARVGCIRMGVMEKKERNYGRRVKRKLLKKSKLTSRQKKKKKHRGADG